ncbi:hypothetical protein ACFLU6_14165, partial [Acidobacteriota bacterium]
ERDDGEVLKIVYHGHNVYCNYRKAKSKMCFCESDEKGFFHVSRQVRGIEGNVIFCVRPESTLLYQTEPKHLKRNVFSGKVTEIFDRGLMFQCNVKIDENFQLVNLTMRKRFLDLNVKKDDKVFIGFDEKNVHIIDEGVKSIVTDISAMKDLI